MSLLRRNRKKTKRKKPIYEDSKIKLYHDDCLKRMQRLKVHVDSIITDPPYGLEFMGKEWDAPWQVSTSSALFGKRKTAMPGWGVTRNPNCKTCGGRLRGKKKCKCATPNWDESVVTTRIRQMSAFQDWCTDWAEACLAVTKPGGFLLAFGGTRTFHRLTCAIEDAGWEIRDCIMWVYGSGFPKSLDISKAIDKAAGVEREFVCENPNARGNHDGTRIWIGDRKGKEQSHPPITAPATDEAREWSGYGTALKPAWEPIIVAMKPLDGTFAQNAQRNGVAGLAIDACRVPHQSESDRLAAFPQGRCTSKVGGLAGGVQSDRDRSAFVPRGRDGEASSDRRYPESGGTNFAATPGPRGGDVLGRFPANLIHDGSDEVMAGFPQSKESAARFFYCAKASRSERGKTNKHPTVKPLSLMRYLCRLTKTPTGGTVLDPFAGSGSTLIAAAMEGREAIGIEQDKRNCEMAVDRFKKEFKKRGLFSGL